MNLNENKRDESKAATVNLKKHNGSKKSDCKVLIKKQLIRKKSVKNKFRGH